MQLWTHHPSTFHLADANLIVDPTVGHYWNNHKADFRYRDVLPQFQSLVGTTQILWCCTVRGQFIRPTEDTDLVEWELNIPEPSRVRFFRSSVWEDIVRGKIDDWSSLFVDGIPEPSGDIHAIALLPLQANWIKCHGPLRPLRSQADLERARRVAESSAQMNPELRNEYDW